MDLQLNRTFNFSTKEGVAVDHPFQPSFFPAAAERITLITFLTILMVTSILGNTLVIAIVWKNKRMQTTTNFIIVNMAISDLITTFLMIPRAIQIHVTQSNKWIFPGTFGVVICKLAPLVRDSCFFISVLSMVAMALERFFAIVYPTRRRPQLLKLRYALPIIWFIPLVTFSPYLVASYVTTLPSGKTVCIPRYVSSDSVKFHKFFMLGNCTLTFVIPLVAITILYSLICKKMRNRIIPGVQTAQSELITKRRKQTRNILNISLSIVLSFSLLWMPYHVSTTVINFAWPWIDTRKWAQTLLTVQYLLASLCYASVTTNPYICFIFSENFRVHIKRWVLRVRGPSYKGGEISNVTSSGHVKLEMGHHNLGAASVDITHAD